MNILLISNSTQFGSGYLEHCREQLLETIGPGARRVLFVPFALADHDAYAQKARTAFEAMGYSFSSIHRAPDSRTALADADALFVGGGNTFRLLDQIQRRGLTDPLRAAIARGVAYTGASAGTNLATPSIKTTNDMPILMPASFTALGLVPFQINPHYLDPVPGSTHMGETREQRIAEFHEENFTPVVGLREGGMIRVVGNRAQILGGRPVRLFRRGESPIEIPAGSDISFLLGA